MTFSAGNIIKSTLIFRFITAAITASVIFHFGFSGEIALTDFYYYKGIKSRLRIRTDLVFIKTKANLKMGELAGMLTGYPEAAPVEKYDEGEKMQFIRLRQGADERSVRTFVESMNSNPDIEYSSPVYSPEVSTDDRIFAGLTDEVLVQFKPYLSENSIGNYIHSKGFSVIKRLDISGGYTCVLKIPDGRRTLSIDEANRIYESGLANWAEPNLYISGLLNLTPNDEYYPQQWGFRNTGMNIPGGIHGIPGSDARLDSAWNITTGIPQCVICMVDTGIDTTHPDIKQNILTEKGYDFINDHPYPMDDNGHGTVTAGLAAAVQNNSIGISGAAPGCKLIAVKIFNSAANTTSSAMASGIIYSYQQGWISSNSWSVSYNVTAVELAIIDGITSGRNGKGTVFCFATGNNNSNLLWPASNSNVIAVGGQTPCNSRKSPESCDGEYWWGANYGNGLTVVAPSVKVYSTSLNGGYFSSYSGTSVAAPICAGVCALSLSLDSTQIWDSLRIRLCTTADKAGNYLYNGVGPYLNLGYSWNSEMGYGKINAYRLLNYVLETNRPRIVHTPLINTELVTGDREVNCYIEPANKGIIPSLTRLYYSHGNNIWMMSVFANIGGNNWKAYLPLTGSGVYRYYITATDSLNMSSTSPKDAPAFYYSFYSGPDTVKPSITHNVILKIPKEIWPYTLRTAVTDNIGIDSVWVKWYRNTLESGIKEFKLQTNGENRFAGKFNSQNQEVNLYDSVFYRIYAMDNSSNHNIDSTQLFKATIISANRVCIGVANGITEYPFRTQYSDSRTQILYMSNEFPATFLNGGQIVSLGFRINACTYQDFNSFTVRLRHTNLTNHTSWINDGWTTAFSGMYTISDTGWTYIDLIPPYFTYDRAFNLLVEICYDNNTYSENITTVKGTAFINTPRPLVSSFNGPYVGCYLQSKTFAGYRPDICFLISEAVNSGINPIALVPRKYSLEQNFPNPFNPVTRIKFSVPKTGNVRLVIYDILGKAVRTLVNEEKQPGYYFIDFDGAGLPSGVYFCVLSAERLVQTRRMTLIK